MSTADNCTKTSVTRRVTWNPEETKILISLVGKHSTTQNGKLTNAETYQQVSQRMHLLGHKKTPDQCKIKWKHLKNFYYEARKKKTDQERYTICPFYKEIRNAVGSPMSSSVLNSRKTTANPPKHPIKSKHRSSVRTEKSYANTTLLYEFRQQNGSKFDEPFTAIHNVSSSSNETVKLQPQRNQQRHHHISSSVTVSPCSPTSTEYIDKSADIISSSSIKSNKTASNKCSPVEKEYLDSRKIPVHLFQQNDQDHFSYLHSIPTSSSIPTNPLTQPYQENTYTDNRGIPSPTYLSNSPETNQSTYSPEVCIKWNSYQINMQNTLPLLLDGDKFVDVTLACEGKFLKCHKLILSACSSYFDELLSQATSQYPIIFMKDMKFWQIQAIVEFMYRGEVNIAQERLSSLLTAAQALRVKGLAAPSNHSSNLIDSPKLYSSVKRNRKRKHHLTDGEMPDGKSINEYNQMVDMTKMNQEQAYSSLNNQCNVSDEETQFFKTEKFTLIEKDTEIESSCVTTIILPDHNYQQNSLCKLPEYNQEQCESNFTKINNYEDGHLDETLTQGKNHHDHMYSKPQKMKNQHCNLTDSTTNEEDINIHDNTIFYSYLSIDDSNSSKT